MKIAIGCDHNAFLLKEDIKSYLMELGHEVIDFGCNNAEVAVDYPDVAVELSKSIRKGEASRGILMCGTGIGMAIVANKVRGIRAACCHDPYSAERARKSNNAQVLTLGSQIVAPKLARVLIDHWLESEFDGGPSARKVEKIEAIDFSTDTLNPISR